MKIDIRDNIPDEIVMMKDFKQKFRKVMEE